MDTSKHSSTQKAWDIADYGTLEYLDRKAFKFACSGYHDAACKFMILSLKLSALLIVKKHCL